MNYKKAKQMSIPSQNVEYDQRINIDKAKLVQDRDLTEDKLEQNEELAELRADTSLTKQAMSNAAKIDNDLMKMADVKILKGPKR